MVNLRDAWRTHTDANGVAPPKETNNIRVLLLGLFGACTALLYGYDTGFIGGVVASKAFLADFGLTHSPQSAIDAFSSNVVSAFQAGAVIGALGTSAISDRIGRRFALIGNLGLYILGAILMTAASGSAAAGLMYAGRAITGWGVGASSMLVPIYVAECSPQHSRGRLVGLYEVGVQFGVMWGFWVNYLVAKAYKGNVVWRLPVALQLGPSVIAFVSLLFLTETPRHLVRSRGEAAAMTVLCKLRNLPPDHPYVVGEMAGIVGQIEHERLLTGSAKGGVIRETFGKSNRRRLFTGVMIMIFFQMAGTNAVNYYSPRIFQSLGLSAGDSKLFATGIYGVVRFVATLIAMVLLTDRFGRVSMLVTGGSIMAACMWIVGALIKTYPPVAHQAKIQDGQLVAIVFIFIWAVAFCFSYAGIPWIYCAEIFPLRIRTLNVAICTAVHWGFNLMLAKATPYMLTELKWGTYFVFGACSTVGAIWQFFFMKETKGLNLEEIELLYDPTAVTHNMRRRESVSVEDDLAGEKADIDHVEKV